MCVLNCDIVQLYAIDYENVLANTRVNAGDFSNIGYKYLVFV